MAKIHILTEGQVAVRLDWRHLPDLDDLMVEVVREQGMWDGSAYWWAEDDEPTQIRPGGPNPEPEWQWTRISPCGGNCGEHGWHWDSRRIPDGKDLIEDRPPRRFVALEWS
jgi:hypothetical protein